MQDKGTIEAKERLRTLVMCTIAGTLILASLAAGAYWLLDTMFSGAAQGMVRPA